MQDVLSTPLPPDDLMILVCGHANREHFALSRRSAIVDGLLPFLHEAGIDLSSCKSILDFGCGCGRILAGWEGRLNGASLHGVDINPDLVAFCKNNIGFATVTKCGPHPPLDFAEASFDFVYAVSVFTHLSRAGAVEWAKEMARIVMPGRTLVATFHGSWYDAKLAELSMAGLDELHRFGVYVHRFGDAAEGSNDYAAFICSDIVPMLFREFDVIKHYPGASRGPTHFAAYQDVAIMRRKSSSSS